MGFGTLNPQAYDDDINRRAAAPAAPEESSFSLWSFTKAGASGVPRAFFEVAASVRDWSSSIDEFRQAEENLRAAAAGTQPRQFGRMESGAPLRAKAEQMFAPDPETAHTADQVVHGLSRFVTKAVGGAIVAGPVVGGALAGVEEGNTTAQDLIARGIDRDTAAKVGATVGAASALSIALPAGGSTLARTMAIAATGGPATFVAQESMARKILAEAGYKEEAAKHDPTDPLGLALSIIPSAAVGALHMRGVNKRAAELKYAREADLKATAALTPAEQAASDAFERSAGNIRELEAAIKAEKNPANRAILEAELAKLTDKTRTEVTQAAVSRAADDPEVVAAARVQVLEEVSARNLPDAPGARADVARAADELGAGRMPMVEAWDAPQVPARIPEFAELADDLRGMGTAAYWAQEGGSIVRSGRAEPGDGGMGGEVVGRTTWIPAEEWFGRMRSDLGRDGLSKQADIQEAIEAAIRGDKLKAKQARTVEWIRNEVIAMREEAQRVKYEWDDPDLIARDAFDAGLSSRDMADAAMVSRAAEIDEASVERLAIAHDGDDAAFMAGIREILGNEQVTETQRPHSRVIARGEETPTAPAAEPAAVRPEAAEPAQSLDAQRLATLEAENPDMRVILPGETEPMTLADALRKARDTADDEASFADLVRVAAECALTAG